LARSANGADRMTLTGHLIGTPAFMSPEQAGGEALDIRSDIYSLGATLFALVTGRQPFVANTPIAVAAKAMVEPAPDPRTLRPELSASFAKIILCAMDKDPSKRFQTPMELKATVESLSQSLRSPSPPTHNQPVTASIPRRKHARSLLAPTQFVQKWFWASIGLAILVGALFIADPLHHILPSSSSRLPNQTADSLISAPGASAQTNVTINAHSLPTIDAPVAQSPRTHPPTVDNLKIHPHPPAEIDPPKIPWAYKQGKDKFGHFIILSIHGVFCSLRWIPPGSCLVGSPDDEPGHHPYERRSQVTFKRGFWLCDTECTQELWMAVTGTNPSKQNGRLLPVTNVSVTQAISFTRTLRPLLNSAMVRLPTRAEWERACRAESTTAFANGDSISSLHGFANLNGQERQSLDPQASVLEFSDDYPDLAMVANLRPNRWGFFDMHGNVAEFCLGRWAPLPITCDDPETDDHPDGQVGIIRGGGFDTDGTTTRCAALPYIGQNAANHNVGFRFIIEDVR
jgi:formylglycine-generating enzyme